jgi:hypothetical protein
LSVSEKASAIFPRTAPKIGSENIKIAIVISLPIGVSGEISPYPTVVIVTAVNQKESVTENPSSTSNSKTAKKVLIIASEKNNGATVGIDF